MGIWQVKLWKGENIESAPFEQAMLRLEGYKQQFRPWGSF